MDKFDGLDMSLVIDKMGSRLRGLVIKNLENIPEQGEKIFINLKEI